MVHSCTSAFRSAIGPGAIMLDHLGRRRWRRSTGSARGWRPCSARRGSRRRTDRRRRSCRPPAPTGAAGIAMRLAILDARVAPCGAAGDDQRRHLGCELVERLVEIGAPVSCSASSSLANSKSTPPLSIISREAFLAPGDAHAFAQGEGDLAARGVGDLDRLHHRRARLVRAPTDSLRGTGSRPRRSDRDRALPR